MRRAPISWRFAAAASAALMLLLALAALARADPVTYANDALRTGWYPDQATLTPDLVSGGTFGQLFSTPVNGQVYAQPLVSNGVLFVATESNWIYGLDPHSGAVSWQRNVGTPFNAADVSCSDLTPTIGVTGTPVIDPATGTAYFFAKTYASGSSGAAAWDLHAVDVTTGAERPAFPVRISGTAQNNPLDSFNATQEMQRPGLLLMDGVVYAAFGAHCDHTPYQGWVVGVSTQGTVRAMWVARGGQNLSGAGIWHSGGGLVSDGANRILLVTGNGGSPPVPTPGSTPPASLGESVVRLQVQADGSLVAADFFAPYDSANLDSWDADLGSGAPTALPPQYFGTSGHPHLVVQAGKQGYVYLYDADNLGGTGMGPNGGDAVVKRIGPNGGVWSRPAVWPGDGGYVYIPTASGGTSAGGSSGFLRVYRYLVDGTGAPSLALAATSSDAFGFGSSAPVVTSDGTTSGSAIVWMVWMASGSGSGAQLRAYSALPSAGQPALLFSAPVGTATKFTPPGVAGGRLYVGSRDGHVVGFGAPVDPPLAGASLSFPATTIGSSSQLVETLTATRSVSVTGVASTSPLFVAGTPSRSLPAALSAGDTISVPVTFSPTAAGQAGGSLQIATSETQVNVGLSGAGVSPAPQLSVTPPAVSFGGARVGGHLTGTIVVSNVGGAPMTIASVSDPAAPFSLSGAPAAGTVVAPGASLSVDVNFDPVSAGSYTDSTTVSTDGGSADVGMSGSAAAPPRLDIAPAALDFGTVAPGGVVSSSFTVKNGGATDLTITKSKPPAGGIFVAASDLSEGTTLAPGDSRDLTVEFRPAALGPVADAWTITGDDGSGVHAVDFGGVGGVPAASPPPGPGGGGGGGGLPPPGGPVFGPVPAARLHNLRVLPHAFRAGARATVRFDLSRAATVTLAVERQRPCRAGRRCDRYARMGHAWRVAGAGGHDFAALPRELGGVRLGAGVYRLVARPAGGAAERKSFRVTR